MNNASRPRTLVLYRWQGRDRQGHSTAGQEHATSPLELSQQLRARGVFAAQVTPVQPHRTKGKALSAKDVTLFTRQLATMMGAGIPLLQAFDIAARSTRTDRMIALIEQVSADVQAGKPLHVTLAQYPASFDALYCASIASGEAAGSLDQVLEGLALHLEKSQALRSKVRAAMMYPLVVATVSTVAVSVIIVWVVPAFETQFTNFGAPLPGPTRAVMALSHVLVHYGWLLALGLVGGAWWVRRAWQRGGATRKRLDQWALRVPVLGKLVRKAVVARWTRTLSTMSGAGVPLLEALPVVGHACGNHRYWQGSAQMATDVGNGLSLSAAMDKAGLFPPAVLHMCVLGEESGTLDRMLVKCAEVLESEVDDAVAGFSSILEPAMVVVLGVSIGAIVLAMYLPIFQLGRVI